MIPKFPFKFGDFQGVSWIEKKETSHYWLIHQK